MHLILNGRFSLSFFSLYSSLPLVCFFFQSIFLLTFLPPSPLLVTYFLCFLFTVVKSPLISSQCWVTRTGKSGEKDLKRYCINRVACQSVRQTEQSISVSVCESVGQWMRKTDRQSDRQLFVVCPYNNHGGPKEVIKTVGGWSKKYLPWHCGWNMTVTDVAVKGSAVFCGTFASVEQTPLL